ncbi:16S rRNA (cytidine(1402)-2'-O)-methyltransferase [Anaerotardibacter muris]|uniref:16S rRNA (cytidine(1402)-2'-O)-methyltransferase n=1 Tax=Anaerotardibacter muris TaxID=2941505 RepID=UPI0023B994A1|nr:16S rRNA (cytidine(1402)-2'-O)-methyltransferase [Anaerotardibacter muris]
MSTQGKLIICPTPLGNLGDMTARAKAALETCDVVCCEDTRVTGKLLAALGIQQRLERLDEASIAQKAPAVLDRIAAGETVCYCSDAGMPGVSDPGQRLIDQAYERDLPVEVLPGGTAAATAYVASGFTSPAFYFGAFFPRKAGERAALLESLRGLDAALIFYESPQRVASALEAIAAAYPLRQVAVCRELTKLHEEVVRGRSDEVARRFAQREQEGAIKGEIVLVVDAPSDEETALQASDMLQVAREEAQALLQAGELSKKEIVAHMRDAYGLARNDAYEIVHGA